MSAWSRQQPLDFTAALMSGTGGAWPLRSSVNEIIVPNGTGTISADEHHKKRFLLAVDSYHPSRNYTGAGRTLDDRSRPNPHTRAHQRAG